MRVAMIGAKAVPFGASGITRQVEEVGSRLVQRGVEVDVYVRRHLYEDGRIPAEHRGMRLIPMASLPTKHLDTLSVGLLATLDAMRRKVNVVHYLSTPLAWYAPLARLRAIKSVVIIQGFEWQRPKWGAAARAFLKLSEWATLRLPDGPVACSETLYEYARRLGNGRLLCIRDGVAAIERVEPQEILVHGLRTGGYILYMGRIDEAKGCHGLLEAYLGLDTDKVLVFAGSPKFSEAYFERLRARAAGNPRVLFLGAVDGWGRLWQELFTNAYLYVQPSESEGLSQSLLEAMSAANCVVVSRIEANEEAVGACGFYFANRDWQALRSVLAHLLAQPALVADTAARARQRARERFSWDVTAEGLHRLYCRLVNGQPL